MKATNLFAAIATFAVAGSVFAQEYVQPGAGFVSTKSRAEVKAELLQARASGSLQISESAYPAIPSATSNKSRREVQAELAQARETGALRVLDDEYPVVQISGTSKSREQVREELARAIANGEVVELSN